jgi:hypothetical protein
MFAGILAAGCALFPLGEADCRPPNWRQVGYAHGYGGHLPQDLRLQSECRERYGAEIDQTAYLQGWRDGYDEWDRLIGSMRNRSR